MRPHFVTAAMLMVLVPSLALAQTRTQQTAPMTTTTTTGDENNRTASSSTRPDPSNCGTPDEPKSCPPMPRHPLHSYPPNR